MGGSGIMLHDRLFRQVNHGWVRGLRLLVLLLLLGEARRLDIAGGWLLPIPSNEAPEEPRMI